MSTLIEPKILKGFRDFLPHEEIRRGLLIETVTGIFRKSGFVPIDTPALEYSDILLRKSNGETEKQVFRFTDNGGRDVALRFDLTVPFARYIAEHYSDLYFPFKRYHIAKVWRGEKPQAGRYREFVQCDFDIVGSDCAYTDFEILSVMCKSMQAIGVSHFKIHLSHRGIFNRFLKNISVESQSEAILRIVDKIAKIGQEAVREQLSELAGAEKAAKIVAYSTGALQQDFTAALQHAETLAGGEAADTLRMKEVYQLLCEAHIADYFIFDPSITRGLDYYTGIVYETFLTELPQIGSVCSGGRYDNLTGLYMKEAVSGVGASIGLDRLIAGLAQLGMNKENTGFIDALIFNEKNHSISENLRAAQYLSTIGVHAEVFPEPKKLQQQYTYAEKKGIAWGVFFETISGQNGCNVPQNTAIGESFIRLKHLPSRTEKRIALKDVKRTMYDFT